MPSDPTIQTKIQKTQGGDELAVASGGTLALESGSTHTAAGTRNATGVDNVNSGGVVNVKSGATVDMQSGSTHTAAGTRNATGVDNINSGGVVNVKSGAALDLQSGAKVTYPYIEKSASFTVLASQSGMTFLCKAVDMVMTLPATAVGLVYTFIVHTVSSGTGLSIDPVTADAIMGNGLTSVDDKDLINTAATDAEGDSVTLVADGADGWWITSINGTWAKE